MQSLVVSRKGEEGNSIGLSLFTHFLIEGANHKYSMLLFFRNSNGYFIQYKIGDHVAFCCRCHSCLPDCLLLFMFLFRTGQSATAECHINKDPYTHIYVYFKILCETILTTSFLSPHTRSYSFTSSEFFARCGIMGRFRCRWRCLSI